MGGFFSLDGTFSKFGTMLADVMILSLIWILFSIPIFTIGASTTALYFVTTRRISNKEGYLFKDFFTSFKREFKQATITWLFIMLIGGILLFNITNQDAIFQILPMPSLLQFIFRSLQFCLFIELFFFSVFVFPLLSRFTFSTKTLFMNAFFMANRHFLTTLLCILIAATVVVFILFSNFIGVLVGMGAYVFSTSYFIMKIFKKHRPEIDEDDFSLNSI